MNFYKHHLGDYDGATAHLSWEEDLAYTRLLRAYYRREKPIPSNPGETFRLVRANTACQKKAVSTVLNEFFVEMEDGWHNKRADEEICAYQSQCETNRKVGRLGGRPKKTDSVPKEKPNDNRTETEMVSRNNPNQEPRTINQEPDKNKSAGRKRPLPVDFAVSDRVRDWAGSRGYERLEAHLEHFVGWARASGKSYADWDQAFMNAIRDDWAKLRGAAAPDYSAVMRQIEEEEIANAKH